MPRRGVPSRAAITTKRKIAKLARQLREILGVDGQHAPNLLMVVGKLESVIPGFKLKLVADKKSKIEAWTNSKTRKIYLTERVWEGLQWGIPRARFTLAHEIGHLVLRHANKNNREVRRRYEKNSHGRPRLIIRKNEVEANNFASKFLMPGHLIVSTDTVVDISRKFCVSHEAARYRLEQWKKCKGREDAGSGGTFVWDAPAQLGDEDGPPMAPDAGEKFAFVAMEFTPASARLYRDVIKPIVTEYGIKCRRGDELPGCRSIVDQIRVAIDHCRVLVADITGLNANVLIEIGMAVFCKKSVLLICRDGCNGTSIPYNIQHLRVHGYTDDMAGGVKFHQDLIEALRSTLRSV